MPIAADIQAEAERLTSAVVDAGLGMRLMGGLAIWLVAPSVRLAPFARPYGDLDFAVRKRDGRRVTPFLAEQGYVPEKLFNSIHGAQRLNFGHPEGRWTIDVIIDELRMSHLIDLRGRLEPGAPTLDLADLLLTKLQVWEINEKDFGDIACLLADRPLASSGTDASLAIDVTRILRLTGEDWGLCHTVERNLGSVAAYARERGPSESAHDPAAQAETLLAAIESGRKSIAWRVRSRVGERVRWYERPEEIRH